eukprot:6214312-Pleurochrysis_carterae.AAC.1
MELPPDTLLCGSFVWLFVVFAEAYSATDRKKQQAKPRVSRARQSYPPYSRSDLTTQNIRNHRRLHIVFQNVSPDALCRHILSTRISKQSERKYTRLPIHNKV